MTDDGVFLFIKLDLCAGILAGDNLIARLYVHFNFLAIHKPTGADRNNLRDLRFLLSGRCEDEAALRSLFYLDEFHNDAV